MSFLIVEQEKKSCGNFGKMVDIYNLISELQLLLSYRFQLLNSKTEFEESSRSEKSVQKANRLGEEGEIQRGKREE